MDQILVEKTTQVLLKVWPTGRLCIATGLIKRLTLTLNGTKIFENGEPLDFHASDLSRSMQEEPLTHIDLVVGIGGGTCTHWTSDLTVEYVRFNSEYTT